VKNKFFAGETLEVLNTDGSFSTIKMPVPLITKEGKKVDYVNHTQFILIDQDLKPYTILRRVND